MSFDPKYFKGRATSASVTTSSSQIVDANKTRKYMVIRNLGPNTIFLNVGKGRAAEVDKGIQLQNSEWWEVNNTNMCVGSVNAIGDGGAATVSIFESDK
jgi:hypothetical protein